MSTFEIDSTVTIKPAVAANIASVGYLILANATPAGIVVSTCTIGGTLIATWLQFRAVSTLPDYHTEFHGRELVHIRGKRSRLDQTLLKGLVGGLLNGTGVGALAGGLIVVCGAQNAVVKIPQQMSHNPGTAAGLVALTGLGLYVGEKIAERMSAPLLDGYDQRDEKEKILARIDNRHTYWYIVAGVGVVATVAYSWRQGA